MQEMQETGVQSLGREDALEEDMATHVSILAYGEPHRQRSLVDYSPWSPTESDTSGCTHTHPYFQTHGGDGVEAERYFALNTAGNTWTEW